MTDDNNTDLIKKLIDDLNGDGSSIQDNIKQLKDAGHSTPNLVKILKANGCAAEGIVKVMRADGYSGDSIVKELNGNDYHTPAGQEYKQNDVYVIIRDINDQNGNKNTNTPVYKVITLKSDPENPQMIEKFNFNFHSGKKEPIYYIKRAAIAAGLLLTAAACYFLSTMDYNNKEDTKTTTIYDGVAIQK